MLRPQIVKRAGAEALVRAVLAVTIMTSAAFAADLKAPKQATAGEGITITAGDNGELMLFGPGGASKRKVSAGEVQIPAEDLRAAGHYVALMAGSGTDFCVI